MKKLVLSLCFAAAMLSAGDVSGKWTAEVTGRGGRTRTTTFNLKQDGANLTGTVTGMGGQENPISDGKVDGDNVSFKVKVEFNANTMTMVYQGKLDGEELKLKMGREGADQMRDVTAKKAK